MSEKSFALLPAALAVASHDLSALAESLKVPPGRSGTSDGDHFVLLQLFDAAIVANKRHAASWHGWGLLEKRQGNFARAKDLWLKVKGPPAR